MASLAARIYYRKIYSNKNDFALISQSRACVKRRSGCVILLCGDAESVIWPDLHKFFLLLEALIHISDIGQAFSPKNSLKICVLISLKT